MSSPTKIITMVALLGLRNSAPSFSCREVLDFFRLFTRIKERTTTEMTSIGMTIKYTGNGYVMVVLEGIIENSQVAENSPRPDAFTPLTRQYQCPCWSSVVITNDVSIMSSMIIRFGDEKLLLLSSWSVYEEAPLLTDQLNSGVVSSITDPFDGARRIGAFGSSDTQISVMGFNVILLFLQFKGMLFTRRRKIINSNR